MKKIRINELARELEVKAHEILDRLPELGDAEKKTHSSSIDEDVAIKLRRLYGFDAPDMQPESESEPVTEAAPAEMESKPDAGVREAEKQGPPAAEALPAADARAPPDTVADVSTPPAAATLPA